jgi:hypothetical protein
MFARHMRRIVISLPIALGLLMLAQGCSPTRVLIGVAANALGGEGPGWGTDDDPELIGEATPFALKTMESLLASEPDNDKLLLGACSGFTQYAYAFVQMPADLDDHMPDDVKARAHARAIKLLQRANAYCWLGLDTRHEKITELWAKDRNAAMNLMTPEDVPFIYWAAASLALQISLQKDKPDMLAELPAVGVLGERALALNESWEQGTLHELLLSYYASLPAAGGGSVPKAKEHLDKALAQSQNKKLGPLVSWAEDVDVSKQDKNDFVATLDKVLAFDVDQPAARDFRLANVLAQRRAAWLKAHIDDYFP